LGDFFTNALFYALKDAATTAGHSISSESIELEISFVVAWEEKREIEQITKRYTVKGMKIFIKNEDKCEAENSPN